MTCIQVVNNIDEANFIAHEVVADYNRRSPLCNLKFSGFDGTLDKPYIAGELRRPGAALVTAVIVHVDAIQENGGWAIREAVGRAIADYFAAIRVAVPLEAA